MLKEKQVFILAGGALIALIILRKKPQSGSTAPRKGLLSTLFPTLGTNSPFLRSANMATQGGYATYPRSPSSGLGYTRTTGITAPVSPVQAAIAGGPQLLGGLFNWLASRNILSAQQRPTQGGSGKQSSGGSGGYGGGAPVSPGRPTAGGPAGLSAVYPQAGVTDPSQIVGGLLPPGQYYDPITGTWQSADPNVAPLDVGALPGATVDPISGLPSIGPVDDAGNPVSSTLPAASTTPNWSTLPAGSVDENGNFDPTVSPDVQLDPSANIGGTGVAQLDPTTLPGYVAPDVSTDPFAVDASLLGPGAGGGDDTTLFDTSSF